ncbi:MAG TPA: class IV adenylate cyclase [Candidatus Dormibacteraeota bacterium]|jgi:adenylate cyclase, class 2|nr:class IV adenylate cyclase [Candidatus Dormibacteraeota bacterium]
MPEETEIKLKIRDLKAFQRILKRLGAKPVGSSSGRVHEENLIFDTPDGGLAKHGQLLRLRTETVAARSPKKSSKTKKSRKTHPAATAKPPAPTRQILTFKRPTAQQAAAPTSRYPSFGSHKVRDEIEAQVTDTGNLVKIFEGLGMRGWFRYEKYRTTYKLPATKSWARDLLIEVDETPIGTFVELEGPPAAIDRAATELGYSKRDYILTNYLALYAEDCRRKGQQPQNMLFPNKFR